MVPQRHPHARQQFADAERPGQAVVRPGVQRSDLAVLLAAGDSTTIGSGDQPRISRTSSRPSPSGRLMFATVASQRVAHRDGVIVVRGVA